MRIQDLFPRLTEAAHALESMPFAAVQLQVLTSEWRNEKLPVRGTRSSGQA